MIVVYEIFDKFGVTCDIKTKWIPFKEERDFDKSKWKKGTIWYTYDSYAEDVSLVFSSIFFIFILLITLL